MPKKKIIPIDPDIRAAATEYVNKQLDVMEKYGSRPELSPEHTAQLVFDVAKYPQEIRNHNTKWRNKRKIPHSMGYAGREGWSLLCYYCNTFEYIKDVDQKDGYAEVTCSKCKHVHPWMPLTVICASPTHNNNGGCHNILCWKKRQ